MGRKLTKPIWLNLIMWVKLPINTGLMYVETFVSNAYWAVHHCNS